MKKNDKKTYKLLPFIIVLIVLLVTILALSNSWAKPIKSISNGISNWTFNVDDSGFKIDLIETTSTSANRVEPGTSGKFQLYLNSYHKNILSRYNLQLTLINIPKNLKFYEDKEMKKELPIINNKIDIQNFVGTHSNSDSAKIIYWNWPYQTGTTPEEIYKNDLIDSSYAGQAMEIQINAIKK